MPRNAMKKDNPLYKLLWIMALLVLVCSFLLIRQTFDIRIFDTFYVIHLKNLYWWLALALIVLRLFYYFEPLPLFSERLKTINMVLTLLASTGILAFHIYSGQLIWGEIKINVYDVPLFYRHNLVLTGLLFFLAIAQIPLGINAAWGIYLKNFRKASV